MENSQLTIAFPYKLYRHIKNLCFDIINSLSDMPHLPHLAREHWMTKVSMLRPKSARTESQEHHCNRCRSSISYTTLVCAHHDVHALPCAVHLAQFCSLSSPLLHSVVQSKLLR